MTFTTWSSRLQVRKVANPARSSDRRSRQLAGCRAVALRYQFVVLRVNGGSYNGCCGAGKKNKYEGCQHKELTHGVLLRCRATPAGGTLPGPCAPEPPGLRGWGMKALATPAKLGRGAFVPGPTA
jgi:hypothetical protein